MLFKGRTSLLTFVSSLVEAWDSKATGLKQADRTQHILRRARCDHIVSKLSHLSIRDFFSLLVGPA